MTSRADKAADAPVTSSGAASSGASNFSQWADAAPKNVGFADALGDKENSAVWAKLYKEAGMKQASEAERRGVRAAVYVYCCLNGTSREGDYGGVMTLYDGREVEAAVIPRAAGKMKIRRFLRANMSESYTFFKESAVMETNPRFVARVAGLGISAEHAFATADWMDDCPHFTPAEVRAHETSFTRSVDRARRARGGKTLEQVEGGRLDEAAEVNGPQEAGHTISW